MILFRAKIVVDGVDLSNQCRRLAVPGGRVMRPDNTMGDEMEKMAGGPKNGQLTATFRQSFLADGVHAKLQALLDANVPFTVTIVPDKDEVVSEDNPKGEGSFLIESYTPIDTAWGEIVDTPVTFRNAEGADFVWSSVP